MNYTATPILAFLRAQKDFFKKEYKVKKIGVFGSWARGDANEESDIDIVVDLENPDLFYLIGVKQAIEETFGKRVDIVRMRAKMNKTLRKRIEHDVIYA
ncbi:MAG: nucleotidyltransferase family protein [Ignavibacteriae bacterium]|nr:nucleotidyltransferase family protein [Ignavibacteriota bacterium]